MSNALLSSDLENAVEIDWFADNDEVVVIPRDQLRFTIQKDRAIEALRIAKNSERFELQFRLLLRRLALWVKQRTRDVHRAIITLQDNSLMFVVMQSINQYNEQLQDDLAKLDIAIAQDHDLDLIMLRTVMLPPIDNDALGSFLDMRMVLQYHGK